MSKKYNGWAMKNKWGTILIWTTGYLKRHVIAKIGGKKEVEEWKKEGHKIIKVKLVEVE